MIRDDIDLSWIDSSPVTGGITEKAGQWRYINGHPVLIGGGGGGGGGGKSIPKSATATTVGAAKITKSNPTSTQTQEAFDTWNKANPGKSIPKNKMLPHMESLSKARLSAVSETTVLAHVNGIPVHMHITEPVSGKRGKYDAKLPDGDSWSSSFDL